MKTGLQKTAVILIATLLILTTGGFSIYHHVCSCLGNTSTSIFYKATCEHENSREKSSCCRMEKTPSCCVEKHEKDTKPVCHKDNCCQNSSRFLKIGDSFHAALENISLKPFAIVTAFTFFDIPAEDHAILSITFFNADLPPPDSGRQILVAHHQLKLAPSIV